MMLGGLIVIFACVCGLGAGFVVDVSVTKQAPTAYSKSYVSPFKSDSVRLYSSSPGDTLNGNGNDSSKTTNNNQQEKKKKTVIVIGAGWGGLSAAYSIKKGDINDEFEVTVVDAAPRIGGLVRDGFRSMTGQRPAEAGQHGFWDQYYNIFDLLQNDLGIFDEALTGYAEQGQYSKNGGLEAVWPVYREQQPKLPTGLAQAIYTKFQNLPVEDRITAFPLVLAFSEFDDSEAAWRKYDTISFRDLCVKLGVSKRCFDEAFEPMILTGLFAPGSQVSAAAALGMAYFFVLSNQNAFDVRWCKGNIGEQIFDPWMDKMKSMGIKFQTSTRVTGFEVDDRARVSEVKCAVKGDDKSTTDLTFQPDTVIFAVGAAALNAMVRNSPELSKFQEYRRFANLRGTSVLATRLYLDRHIATPYTANACWGFDAGVGMTFFNIGELHDMDLSSPDSNGEEQPKTILEVDYYHANPLLVMNDEQLVEKVKSDLDCMLGNTCKAARVLDAAIVRLPNAVNWYYPDSYKDMPDLKSSALSNVYFAGDLVRTRHGSWSQEKAYVTGIEVANLVLQKNDRNEGIIPLPKDEPHVAFGRSAVAAAKTFLGLGDPERAPSLANFLF
uniref:Amine oxidase domain-containing protein n=1 Tax=Entomoneis paludosa TaxID=265537 RepID=A0A7S2VEM7_9STRA|mmetsp:Transcript_15679/g.32444  ORF Transcript_15679/g.32444 Transcript_15679/m.32444 type:complete len:609 (+) Transcript_15679:6-1832(+)